jgi:hypothetical protein
MAKQIAIALLVASLALLVIYGVDVMVASQNNSTERMGFLPFNESVRGAAFGGGAVIMSIIAFVIAGKEHAPAVSALLFVNGGLIIAGMIALIGQGALNSPDPSGTMRTIGSTIGMGAILIGLGAWKAIKDKKAITARGKEPTQN